MATQKTRTLEEVTLEFGESYTDAKVVTADKARLQTEFFALATKALGDQTLALKTVTMPEGTVSKKGDVEKWVATHYPGWRLVDFVKDSAYDLVIEEDPALMAFSYINPEDHFIYARTTAQGTPMLDDERLQSEDPKLWEEISEYPDPWFSLVEGAIKYTFASLTTMPEGRVTSIKRDGIELLYELNPSALAANFLDAQGVTRSLRPIEDLTDKQLESLQEYLVPAPITTRLVPPRAAKKEELEEAGLA